ncbi:hypothetical protein ACF09G_32110 [Streptomyces albogriseolus]|uniref:hypothetical protein n=1 Tax=Streptomyces albogriseolus TaxID=1887 RepID=UPI0036F65089
MSTPTSPMPEPSAPAALAVPAPATWQLSILTVWHPALGMAVDPVAVLARDTAPDANPAQHVAWVPLVYDEADPWRERLAEGVTPAKVDRWQEEHGVCQLSPTDVPPGATDLRHAAELVLDQLLAEVIPALPPRDGA